MLQAQSYSVLHRFLPGGTDGVLPSTLTLKDGVLYGTTKDGGTNNTGTIYKIDAVGTNYQIIQHFDRNAPIYSGWPIGSLVVNGDSIYGVAQNGLGPAWLGTVYGVNTNGSNFRVLHFLNDPVDGSYPSSGLILRTNALIGLARCGGGTDYGAEVQVGYGLRGGALFSVNTNATGWDSYSFLGRFARGGENPLVMPFFDLTYVPKTDQIVGISMDTADFNPPLDSLLHIVPYLGNTNFNFLGSIFSINAGGGTPVRSFQFTLDTGRPTGPLLLDDSSGANIVYGATELGIYRFNLDNQQFSFIHTFTNDFDPNNYAAGSSYLLGVTPVGKLAKINDKIFGVCVAGGGQVMVNLNVINGLGVVFQVNTNGDNFRVLHRFDGFKDGAAPLGGLVADGHNLYGTTVNYGSADANITGNGTIFKLDLDPPPLVIDVVPIPQYTNVLMIFTNIFSQPTNVVVGYTNIYAMSNTISSPPVFIGYHTNVYFATNLSYYQVTNINVYTNHVSLGFATNPAALWRLDDGMSHQLLQSTTLFGGGTSNWIPLLPNWTNAVDTNQIGTIIKVNPNIPQAFFKLQSTLLGP